MPAALRRLRGQGLSLASMLHSVRLSRCHDAWGPDGPQILATRGSHIDRHPSARLELDGPLHLGHWPSGPPSAVPAMVQMHEGSVLRVKGWAVLAGGSVVVVGPGALLELEGDDWGEGVIVSTGARIVCMQHVRIGGGGGLSWEAQVLDTDQHHIVSDGADEAPPHTAPVYVGDRVMIGSRASVLKGVTIGDDAIIATGAIVTGDVAAKTLVAGNPARTLREGVRWV
jgi:acetyltransferase-like isoleucine patch superfamily enzyme